MSTQSLYKIMVKNIENSVENLISQISEKYSLDREELRRLWTDEEFKPAGSPNKKSSVASTILANIDTEDLSPARLATCTKVELSALCKSKGLRCTGKKDELIARLTGESTDEKGKATKGASSTASKTTASKTTAPKTTASKTTAPKTTGSKSSKESRSGDSTTVIAKLVANIPAIPIRKNAFGNLVHPETGLVFDKARNNKVSGRQLDDGAIAPLTDEDIQNCKKFKFTYDLPKNLDTAELDKKIDELDDDEDIPVDDDDVPVDDDIPVDEDDVEELGDSDVGSDEEVQSDEEIEE